MLCVPAFLDIYFRVLGIYTTPIMTKYRDACRGIHDVWNIVHKKSYLVSSMITYYAQWRITIPIRCVVLDLQAHSFYFTLYYYFFSSSYSPLSAYFPHHHLFFLTLSTYSQELISPGDGTNFPKPGDKLTMHYQWVSLRFWFSVR